MAKLVPWRWEEAFLPRGFEGTKNRTYSVGRALADETNWAKAYVLAHSLPKKAASNVLE